MAKIALIGASGNAGSRILKELSDRGHQVTGIARNPDKVTALPNVTAVAADLFDSDRLAEVLKGHDAVISSVHFVASNAALLVDAVRKAGVRRYLVVGGAGSLEVEPGKRLLDQPGFPDEYRPEAAAGYAFLEYLKQVEDLEWSFLSPSMMFVPGARTGKFRLGKDSLLTSDAGSSISFEDFAVALADEVEQPQHSRQRFTVGY